MTKQCLRIYLIMLHKAASVSKNKKEAITGFSKVFEIQLLYEFPIFVDFFLTTTGEKSMSAHNT